MRVKTNLIVSVLSSILLSATAWALPTELKFERSADRIRISAPKVRILDGVLKLDQNSLINKAAIVDDYGFTAAQASVAKAYSGVLRVRNSKIKKLKVSAVLNQNELTVFFYDRKDRLNSLKADLGEELSDKVVAQYSRARNYRGKECALEADEKSGSHTHNHDFDVESTESDRVIETLVILDQPGYDKLASKGTNPFVKVQEIMAGVSTVYQRNFGGMKVRATVLSHFGKEFGKSNNSSEILAAFRKWIRKNYPEKDFGFDLAHLFTGKSMDGTTIGLAYLGVACRYTSWSVAVSEIFSTNSPDMITLVAHEMGHNLGSSHTNRGVMGAFFQGSQTFFDGSSRSQIERNLEQTSCLEREQVEQSIMPEISLKAKYKRGSAKISFKQEVLSSEVDLENCDATLYASTKRKTLLQPEFELESGVVEVATFNAANFVSEDNMGTIEHHCGLSKLGKSNKLHLRVKLSCSDEGYTSYSTVSKLKGKGSSKGVRLSSVLGELSECLG